ncbi:MAG: SRPBCC domain-containing protein [Chitinophagaceae bacterium]
MKQEEFKISIDAPPQKVWELLWGAESYPLWTSVFSPGSRAETDWKKGSKVLFLNVNNEGMVSTVAENIPNEYMSFEHVGTVKDGIEDLDSPQTKEWAGAKENYTLKPVDDKTELVVDMDMTDEYKDYFMEAWPKALDKVKELAEKNN